MKVVTIFLLLCFLSAGTLFAKDLYVTATGTGDGSMAKPFGDLQKALDAATLGDVIHVAQGTYSGKLRIGYINIDKRGLTLAGGYKDAKFAERNPFKYPTFIAEDPKSKSSTFEGAYIRNTKSGATTEHQSTTIDGFWFDRKGQNGYSKKGSLGVPTGSNTKPVMDFEALDCHVRNCVIANTALYGVRINGDGSTIENCLFVNVNYSGVDVFGKGDMIGKGYPFPKFVIKNSTFVSAWNCCSLERGAGSFFTHNGRADVTIENNIFHLSSGNSSSMGYVIKDERNFKGEPWIHFKNNSISQMRGGIATVYMVDLTASVNLDFLADLSESTLDVAGNDEENPFFTFEKEWFTRYVSVIPDEDVSNKKVDMDHYNKMRRMLGLPLDGGTREMGANLGTWYPIEHVKTGAFFSPSNEKLKSRGVQASGPFEIVKGTLIAGKEAMADIPVDREYEKTDWATIWTKGEEMIDKPVEFVAYYISWDTAFVSGSGKNQVMYLDGATKSSHKILQLRKIEEMDKTDYPIKGFIKIGSAAQQYVEKKARTGSNVKSKASTYSFLVKGVIKKAGAKVNMGKGPQIVIDIDTITAN